MKRFVVLGLGLFLLATSAVGAYAATDGHRGSAACTAAGKDFDPGGRLYTVYCGPATATVHVAGKTMTFQNGTCVWAPSSFKLQLGTIYFSRKPLQTQSGFSIYAAGGATAKALIQVYWRGAYYMRLAGVHDGASAGGPGGRLLRREDRRQGHRTDHDRHGLLLLTGRERALTRG